ncbi:MAG: two-component sensor histidine kinase [Actinobacteria bacterium]|nr:two-component sensor histidine kinase [Actinomycetota bacterium]
MPDFEAVLNALPLGVVLARRDTVVVFRNRAATAVVGLRHVDLLVEAAVDRLIRQTIEGGAARTETMELFGPPPRVLVLSSVEMVDGVYLVVIEDISERSRIDAVRTDFVANISHELKTPVGALSILAEAMQDETDASVIKHLALQIMKEAHRMSETIDDLLELSKIELDAPLRHNDIDLVALVREAAERHARSALAADVRIETDVPDGQFVVTGDHTQLLSAISNLIDNAVKYSEGGDTVTVRLSREPGLIVIVVEDEGIGIPQPDIDRIFERFYRVDRARGRSTGGTGLGLSIVRHIVANHGGEVNVRSQEGEGSSFRLVLPVQIGDTR